MPTDDNDAERCSTSGVDASKDSSDGRDDHDTTDESGDQGVRDDDGQTTIKPSPAISGATCEEQITASTTWIQNDLRTCTQNSHCQLLLAPSIDYADGCQAWIGVRQDPDLTLAAIKKQITALNDN